MYNKIYMIGGYHGHAYYNAYQYSVLTNSWSPMSDSSLSRWARVKHSILRTIILLNYQGLHCSDHI